MPDLVALDLPAGQRFVDEVRRAWDAGDAVLPVDRRLPAPTRAALLTAMAPTAMVDESGRHRLERGLPAEPGDALVIATSGSTGEPKGVVLTSAAVAASARATTARLGTTSLDTWLACLPLAHVGGFAVVARALHTGAGLVVHDGFDADRVMQAAAAGATCVSLVPTALLRIDPAAFRLIVLGGAHPPDHLPPNVHTTYGLTETGSGVVYDGWPLGGVEVQIAADGEVLVRGPMLLRCYRDGSTPLDDAGWLHTADIGGWLPGGRLRVDGRRGDMINSGGEKVWPDAVEAVLATHPGVAEVAITGVPDPEWGQRVVAWVVPADPAAQPGLDALRDHVSAVLPAFCAPKEVRAVATLPRTALGKVQRHLLS